jgi:hypothetical protein
MSAKTDFGSAHMHTHRRTAHHGNSGIALALIAFLAFLAVGITVKVAKAIHRRVKPAV